MALDCENILIGRIETLKGKPKEEKARKFIEKIAKEVQPIMRKHNWRVQLLSEYWPNKWSLRGTNHGHGVKVSLRLRSWYSDEVFLPYHQVVDTMLHELCHNDHGPHNASFYKLLGELKQEYKGIISGTGQGFDLPGRRLGGVSLHSPLRQVALSAAENRARLQSLLRPGPSKSGGGGGPNKNKLGGDTSIMVGLSPVQAAAKAAERRLQDNIWCGAEFYDLTGDDAALKSHDVKAKSQKRRRESDDVKVKSHQSSSGTWQCITCTLLNPPLASICGLCTSEKPKKVKIESSSWSCGVCTLENDMKMDECSSCQSRRYSYGLPVATSATNHGT